MSSDHVAHGALVRLILAADVPLTPLGGSLLLAHGAAVIGAALLTVFPFRASAAGSITLGEGITLDGGPRFAATLAPVDGVGRVVPLVDHGAAVPTALSEGALEDG